MLENESLIKAFGRKQTAVSDFIEMKGKQVTKQKQHQPVQKIEESRERPQEMIYHAQRKIQTALAKANEDKINGKSILELYASMASQSCALLTRLAALERLLIVSRILNKPFSELTERRWNELIIQLEKRYASWTLYGFSQSVKRMLKFLGKQDNFVKCKARQSTLRPQDLVSKEEFRRMLAKASSPRDRAFLAVLFESGCRIGELLTIKIGNLTFDKYGAKVQVEGKSGARPIRLIASYQALTEYLRNHPNKDDPESWLWRNSWGRMMKYSTAYEILKRLAADAGISKKIFAHLYRHSCASRLAKVLPEASIDMVLGWKIGSPMIARYTHLDPDRTVDEAMLQMHGLAKEEEKDPAHLKCPRCKEINNIGESICRCGFIFDPMLAANATKSELKREKERQDKIEALDRKYAQIEEKLKRLLKEP